MPSYVTSLYRYMPLARGRPFAISSVPVETVITGLLVPLAQDRHPAAGHRKHF